jgi:hypothetical protein
MYLKTLAHARTAAFDSPDKMLEQDTQVGGLETAWEDAYRAGTVP